MLYLCVRSTGVTYMSDLFGRGAYACFFGTARDPYGLPSWPRGLDQAAAVTSSAMSLGGHDGGRLSCPNLGLTIANVPSARRQSICVVSAHESLV